MLILGICVVASTQLSNADDGSCQASDPLRCSLNGDCIAGQCRCDPAWNAHPNCDALVSLVIIQQVLVCNGAHLLTNALHS